MSSTPAQATVDPASPVEDGDTRGVQLGGLVPCPHDEDWYVIEVEEGMDLRWTLALSTTMVTLTYVSTVPMTRFVGGPRYGTDLHGQ